MQIWLERFTATVRRELGTPVSLNAPATDLASCPVALRDLYAVTDGLELPFLELYPMARFSTRSVPGWLEIGFDGYFSFCLCARDLEVECPLTIWDHESGNDPEGCYADIQGLLADAYEDHVDNEHREGTMEISALPPGLRLSVVVAEIKALSPQSSRELLAALRSLPLTIPCGSMTAGIRAVRRLHAAGVQCSIKENT